MLILARSVAYIIEEFEDTKGVIRIRKTKTNRQHNGQKDIQRSTKHTHKPKDQVTRTILNQLIDLSNTILTLKMK